MRLLAIVLAIPTLVLGWQWWGDRSAERTLAPVASAIAGREVAVDCQTFWGALIDVQPRHGEVRFDSTGVPEARIFLTHATCGRLADFADRRRHGELDCLRALDWVARPPLVPSSECYRDASPTIYALLTLAHEAYHTAGVVNEATANCYATQSIGFASVALGAPAEEGILAARAMASLLPYQGGEYRTAECVARSPLDLRPETPAFPTEEPIAAMRGRGGLPGLAAGAG